MIQFCEKQKCIIYLLDFFFSNVSVSQVFLFLRNLYLTPEIYTQIFLISTCMTEIVWKVFKRYKFSSKQFSIIITWLLIIMIIVSQFQTNIIQQSDSIKVELLKLCSRIGQCKSRSCFRGRLFWSTSILDSLSSLFSVERKIEKVNGIGDFYQNY